MVAPAATSRMGTRIESLLSIRGAGPAGPSVGRRPVIDALAASLSRPSVRSGLARQLCGELAEDLDVAVHGAVVVGDRQRPLLLAARRHVDAPVHVVQP